MFEKLKLTEERYNEINEKLSDINVINDNNLYKQLMQEYKNLTPVVEKYREYLALKRHIMKQRKYLIHWHGKDFKEIAQRVRRNKIKMENFTEELKILLLPKDLNDDKNVIIEIVVAGGDMSSFAYSLFRMYSMYAESKNWKIEVLNANETEVGGFKEISFL